MKRLFLPLILLLSTAFAQENKPAGITGIIIGSLVDAENGKPVSGATVTLIHSSDSLFTKNEVSATDGAFLFEKLAFGYYTLKISGIGFTPLKIDSIYIRAERFDFDLNEIKVSRKSTSLEEVVIYVEKPLIENRDGKIIFNVGESALSSGSSTTELLKQTPLVNVDTDGKVMLRGKDVKILIDDKPVELNAKQLQDLLESMPGSMIDKIEVMTTPPPQYANERGGVINIVTKKGRVGMNARVTLNYGTRGEAGINASFGYRKNKISLNASAGFGYNEYQGNSESNRENRYTDSTNYFNTLGASNSINLRPNGRLSLDYQFTKLKSFNFTFLYNSNNAENNSSTEYANLNQFSQLYKLSDRFINSSTNSSNPNTTVTYTRRWQDSKEMLRIIAGVNFNSSENDKNFYQQFLNPDLTFTGVDSTQQQNTHVKNHTLHGRLNYDKPLSKKFTLNLGTNGSLLRSHNILQTEFLKKPEMVFIPNAGLSNDFRFRQDLYALRAALRYDIMENFYIDAGVAAEHTATDFDLQSNANSYANEFWSFLPLINVIKKWKNDMNLTLSYKRTVQRPGINEMNPSIDYSDPYNRRYGNPFLLPYYADNFDLIVGKWTKQFYLNGSVGYNALQNIYSAIRTLQADGKTDVTWQNISGRKEYEASTWGGYTISKKAKANLSLGYTYNVYSDNDRTVRKFRNGGSFYSTLNTSYQFSDLLNSNGSFTFNRFANPQGTVRTALSMNIGAQRKLFKKKFVVSVNVIDPFRQQQNTSKTFGTNFVVQNSNFTQTRNFRVAVAYVFNKATKKKVPVKKPAVKKV